MLTWTLGLSGGIALWTLLEYVLHRFVFHRRVLGKTMAKEHLLHHAQVDYFASAWMKIALAIPILGAITGVAVLALGLELGTSIPLGVVFGWQVYEVIHRRIHTSAPLGSYGRWARRHHLLHHFGRADCNHGVTTPLWDRVFGTLAPRETVKVPRRFASKFPWLAAGGQIAPAFAGDYRLV